MTKNNIKVVTFWENTYLRYLFLDFNPGDIKVEPEQSTLNLRPTSTIPYLTTVGSHQMIFTFGAGNGSVPASGLHGGSGRSLETVAVVVLEGVVDRSTHFGFYQLLVQTVGTGGQAQIRGATGAGVDPNSASSGFWHPLNNMFSLYPIQFA